MKWTSKAYLKKALSEKEDWVWHKWMKKILDDDEHDVGCHGFDE